MAANAKVSARTRARQAQAELLAARAEHDRKVLAATEAWYEASEAREAAEAAVAAAADQQAQTIAVLVGELKVPVEDVASLCGVPASEVRTLARRKSDESS